MKSSQSKQKIISQEISKEPTSKEILRRICEALNIKNQTELSLMFGVHRSVLSNWKARNSIPFEHIVILCNKYDISLDFILLGKGHNVSNSSIINLSNVFSKEELEKLNKAAKESNIPLQNLIRLGIFKMGLL